MIKFFRNKYTFWETWRLWGQQPAVLRILIPEETFFLWLPGKASFEQVFIEDIAGYLKNKPVILAIDGGALEKKTGKSKRFFFPLFLQNSWLPYADEYGNCFALWQKEDNAHVLETWGALMPFLEKNFASVTLRSVVLWGCEALSDGVKKRLKKGEDLHLDFKTTTGHYEIVFKGGLLEKYRRLPPQQEIQKDDKPQKMSSLENDVEIAQKISLKRLFYPALSSCVSKYSCLQQFLWSRRFSLSLGVLCWGVVIFVQSAFLFESILQVRKEEISFQKVLEKEGRLAFQWPVKSQLPLLGDDAARSLEKINKRVQQLLSSSEEDVLSSLTYTFSPQGAMKESYQEKSRGRR